MTHGAEPKMVVHHSQGGQFGQGNIQHNNYYAPRRKRVLVSYTRELKDRDLNYLKAAQKAIKDADLVPCDASRFRTPGEHKGYDVYVNLVGLLYGPDVHGGCSQPEVAFDVALELEQPHFAYLAEKVHVENDPRKLAELRRQEKFRNRVASRIRLTEVADPKELRSKLYQDLTSLIEPSPPSLGPAPSHQHGGGDDRRIEPAARGMPGGEKKSFDWATTALAIVLGLVFFVVALWAVDVGGVLSLGAGALVTLVTTFATLVFRWKFTNRA